MTGPMRVLVLLPVYGRHLPTGAFVTAREYVRGLAAAGHSVLVVTTIREPGEPRVDEDGVRVWPLRLWRRAVLALRPELLISHHGDRRAARIVAQTPNVAHLLMVHGMSDQQVLGTPNLAWFPSQACRDHYPSFRGRALVLPPPIRPELYRTRTGSAITLNGSTPAKGADVLAELAARLPDMEFLLVRAAGHTPELDLPNVTVIERTDPREIYARTRVLMMPSTTESYGRAGIEAMVSGIPVIASPLPGMREAFGTAATYIDRADIDGWVGEIRRLSQPAAYAAASAAAIAHTRRLAGAYASNLRAFGAACLRLRAPGAARPRLGAGQVRCAG